MAGQPTPAAPDHGAVPVRMAASRYASPAAATLVVALICWTIWQRSALDQLAHVFAGFGIVTVLLAVGAVAFVVGSIILACVGALTLRRSAAQFSYTPLGLVRAMRAALAGAPRHRWFFTGWLLASFGSLLPGPTLAVAILASLPSRSWGLVALPAAHFSATLASRLPIHRRILVNRRAA